MKPQRPETADRARQIEREIARLGLSLRRTAGGAYHVLGPGVDLLTVDLAFLSPADLRPNRMSEADR